MFPSFQHYTINNLKNITLLPRFSAICGITEQEVKMGFAEDEIYTLSIPN